MFLKDLKKQIADLHADHENSVKDNLQWYDDNLKDKKSFEVIPVKRGENLKPGKIYRFIYKPETKVALSFYDMNPLVISLGTILFQNRLIDLCLNLNYFPFKMKAFIIFKIYWTYKIAIDQKMRQYPLDAKKQHEYNIDYDVLDKLFFKLNIKFAVRNYIVENRFKTGCISYENLYRVPFIEKFHFKKKPVRVIHALYIKSLKALNKND